MTGLRPEKLHVKFVGEAGPEGPAFPRKYTLTHSDRTGDLFLSIGTAYDLAQISGWYTRLMRDEVLAEYLLVGDGPELHAYCHVSGGLVFGIAGWRYGIFRYHLPMVLQAFYYGDQHFLTVNPGYAHAQVRVHFHSTRSRYHKIESWGHIQDYRL